MLFLTDNEVRDWNTLTGRALNNALKPTDVDGEVRSNLRPAFFFHVGSVLAARQRENEAREWFGLGALEEEEGLFMNAFTSAFLERQGGKFHMPASAFEDPRPFMHFASVPIMRKSRETFLRHCGHTVPDFIKPMRIMDIGCGNGALVASLVKALQEDGKADEIGELLLIDPSPAMLEIAVKTCSEVVPPELIKTMNNRLEEVSDKVQGHYDVALASLSYHHMPWEKKALHLQRMREYFDHLILFELNSNHDTPELFSPELTFSVYQGYGRIIDFVFAHDAPVDVAQACVDLFLMTEAVSILTQPRGTRTDYHMLRMQWHDLFQESLGTGFGCLGDSTCYADDYMDLFMIHYGRKA